ncbi:MAG: thioredoxin family protein [Thermoanaerobaculia bacterium]
MRASALASAVLLLGVVAVPGGGANAQAAAKPVFEPLPNWTLELNGAPSDAAEVLYSREAGAFLVVAPELVSPALLSARTRQVATVQSLKLAPLAQGGYELLPNAVSGPSGSFERDAEGRVSFQVGDDSAVLIQRPWLLGFQNPRRIRAMNAMYDRRMQQYAPSAEVLETLKGAGSEVRVDVYFGEWCPHCAVIVPRILRIDEALGDGAPEFRYYGLPEAMGEDPVTKRLGLRGVPTGIVYRNGEEIGRLYGTSFERPETGLANVLGS